MSNPVPQCTHVKTNGEVCGSPAVSGTEFCYHHSAVKTALSKVQPNGKAANGAFAPIPFVFPEDRASMQINFFLLLQAFNEQRIDQRTYNSMLSMLKAMARNLGKSGSLLEASDQRSAVSDQDDRGPTSQNRDVGHPYSYSRSRKPRNPEDDPNYIPPGYADEVQKRIDRELEAERAARQQQDGAGMANGTGNSHLGSE